MLFLSHEENLVAISDSGVSLSKRELIKLGDELESIIGRDLVFCFCENTLGALAGYIAFVQNGIVPLMLDATKEISLLENMIDVYKPRFLWMAESLCTRFDNYPVVYNCSGYVLLQTRFPKCQGLHEDLALLLTTSGSTGSPKLVRLSYENILSNARSIAEYLEIDSSEHPITSLPMHYSYGLSVINSHLIKGATILLTDRPVIQKEFWAFAREYKATSIAGVPYTYEMLRRLRLFRMDLPGLKTLTQAGGKLNADIVREYVEQATSVGKRFIVMYGQTEATARMSYLPAERALEKCASIGVAIPGGRFEVVDEKGDVIEQPEREGELVYHGSNVSMGYAECLEDLAQGDVNGGVLRTGDIARFDSDGFYYITGRLKRFVKIFGNRVNLEAVEQLVKGVTTSCACVGVDDLVIIFTTESGKEEEIKKLLVRKTGLNARAFAVKIVDSFPKNASGKIQYAELAKLINA